MFKFHLDQAFELERTFRYPAGDFRGLISVLHTCYELGRRFWQTQQSLSETGFGGVMSVHFSFLFPPLLRQEGYDTIELLLNGTSGSGMGYGDEQLHVLWLW